MSSGWSFSKSGLDMTHVANARIRNYEDSA